MDEDFIVWKFWRFAWLTDEEAKNQISIFIGDVLYEPLFGNLYIKI